MRGTDGGLHDGTCRNLLECGLHHREHAFSSQLSRQMEVLGPLENPSLGVEQEQLFLKVQRKDGAVHPKVDIMGCKPELFPDGYSRVGTSQGWGETAEEGEPR